jgi:hypothetical protein
MAARRMRVRDLLILPLVRLDRARRRAELANRRHRADYRRPGSLTYERQQALAAWEARQQRDP